MEDSGRLVPQLDVTQSSPDGGTRIIALRGELDVATVERFDSALDAAMAEGSGALVVDLRELNFIDPSGVMVLLKAVRRVRQAGARMALACANPTVLRLFDVTGTRETFDICATRELALEHVDS